MRNLAQYPVTASECSRALDSSHDAITAGDNYNFGDLRPLCLRYIKEYIELNNESFLEFIKSKETL